VRVITRAHTLNRTMQVPLAAAIGLPSRHPDSGCRDYAGSLLAESEEMTPPRCHHRSAICAATEPTEQDGPRRLSAHSASAWSTGECLQDRPHPRRRRCYQHVELAYGVLGL